MRTRLNSYILPDNIKNDMIDTLDKTQLNEEGFALCSQNNTITKGEYGIGTSNRLMFGPMPCKNEKFLGFYHTHPKGDSQPGAEDLYRCGRIKIVCTGGKKDNKRMCHTYKGEQPSEGEHKKLVYNYFEGKIKPDNPIFQSNLDCLSNMIPLYEESERIKKVDEGLNDRKLRLFSLREPDISRPEIIEEARKLFSDTMERDRQTNTVNEELRKGSRKYYNEVEIK